MNNNAHYLIVLSAMTLVIICSGHNMDYTISSNQYQHLNYYHYPNPRDAHLHDTSSAASTSTSASASASSSSHRNYNSIEQYYQHNRHQHPHPKSYPYQHHQQYASSTTTVTKKFSSPFLDNVAFTMALSRQGYIVDDGVMSSPIVPPEMNTLLTTIGSAQLHTHSDLTQMNSQNVKLPLPLGVTPITFAPLPLQAGAPYSTVRGLTSYGTPYPQRRR